MGLPGTLSLGRVCKHVVQRGIDQLPAVTTFRYDTLGRLDRKELPDAESETLTYHGLTPYLSTRANALGHVQHLRSYHGLTGQPGAVCGPRYATNASTDYCTLTTYDSYGRPLRKHYRALGLQRLLAEYAYQDGLAPSTPPWVRVTEHPDYWGQFGGRAPARPRTTYFDAYGRVMQQVRQTAAGFSKDLFTYDALGRLEAAWRPWSGTSATIFEPPPGMPPPSYRYAHDALDRLVSVRHPDGAIDRTSYEGAWVKQEDAAGHLVWKRRNAHGEVIERHRYSGGRWFPPERFFYDAAGRLIEAADAEGGRYRYAYLWDGSLARAQLPSGSWEYRTTSGGRRLLSLAPDGGAVLTMYDGAGRLDRRMTWDQTPGAASGSRCLVAQPQTTLLTYGGSSRPRDLGLLVSEDGGSYRRAWSYDELGGVATESLTDAASGQTLSINTSRTSLGEPETVRLSNGTTLVRSYDAAGQLVGVRSGDGQLAALLSYDTAGRAQGISAQVGGAGGVTLGRVYEHDDRGLLRRQVTRVGSLGTVSDVSYAYAPDGNPTARVDAVRGDQSTWSYDGADRLTAASDRHGGSGDMRWHLYAYNDNGALLKAIGDGTTTTYVYRDSTESVLAGMTHSRATGALATSYTSSSTGSRCSAGGTDAFGQPLAYRYAWYADGRLAEVVRGGAAPSTLRFDYDARGALWRTSDSERDTTLQLGDGFEARVGGGYRVSVALPGMRCVLPGGFQAATCSFSDTNGVSLTYNAAGALVDERGYEPYGREIRAAGPGPVPPWGYEDKRRHDHGRLLDFGARPYDPLARQFLSVDPLRLEGAGDVLASGNTLQPFVYAAANPIANWDPDGRFPWEKVAKWTGVVALITVAVVATVATAGAAAPTIEGAAITATQLLIVEVGSSIAASSIGGAVGLAQLDVGQIAIEAADGRRMRKLSDGEVKRLQDYGGEDIHGDLKHPSGGRSSRSDLYKDRSGNVYRLPKGGAGEPEPTGVNVNDL